MYHGFDSFIVLYLLEFYIVQGKSQSLQINYSIINLLNLER